MPRESRFSPAPPAALLAILLGTLASAQDLTGLVEAYEYPQYAGVSSHFSASELQFMGEQVFNGEAFLFCSDLAARSIDEDITSYPYALSPSNSTLTMGSLEVMDVWDRYLTPQDEGVARAEVRWLVDNYFESWFLNPSSDADARRYAFQNAIWEIFGDGGTSAGLDFETGNIDRSKFGPGGSSSSPLLWGYMNQLIQAVEGSGVDDSYVPVYQFSAALDSRAGYQDYLILAASPALMVPEPSAAVFCLLGSVVALRRRR